VNGTPHNRKEALLAAWNATRVPLSTWVRGLEAAYNESGMDLLDAAEIVESTAAELEAVIRLALLDDSALEFVSNANPPMTTWLLLSEVASDDIPAVLKAAAGIGNAQSDYQRMVQALNAVTGSAPEGAVQNLDPTLFDFALMKATAYSVWPQGSRHYGAFRSFASRRRSGRPLTSRQTAYAIGLLQEIVEADAIHVPSPDGDDDLCQLLIEAVQ